MQEIVDGHKWR